MDSAPAYANVPAGEFMKFLVVVCTLLLRLSASAQEINIPTLEDGKRIIVVDSAFDELGRVVTLTFKNREVGRISCGKVGGRQTDLIEIFQRGFNDMYLFENNSKCMKTISAIKIASANRKITAIIVGEAMGAVFVAGKVYEVRYY